MDFKSFNNRAIDLAPILNSQLVELDISGNKIKHFKELDKISSLKRLGLKAANLENLIQIKISKAY